MYYSSGNILIGMEKDFHIPTLAASWNIFLFYRKAKASIIVIPIIFSTDRARLDSLIFTRSKMPLFAMCKKRQTISLWFNLYG